MLDIQIANYPDRLGPSGKSVETSTKPNFLEITGYRIKYNTIQYSIVQYSVVASRTSIQAWSKGLDAGIRVCCNLMGVFAPFTVK